MYQHGVVFNLKTAALEDRGLLGDMPLTNNRIQSLETSFRARLKKHALACCAGARVINKEECQVGS